VGRFQPFHYGHLNSVFYALEKCDELVIGIGSANRSHEKKNPFTAGERVEMIKLALEEAGIPCSRWTIVQIPDVELHSLWVSIVKSLSPSFDVVFSNDPLTTILFTEEGVKVLPTPLYEREKCNATQIREFIMSGREEWKSYVPPSVRDFLLKIGARERLRMINES